MAKRILKTGANPTDKVSNILFSQNGVSALVKYLPHIVFALRACKAPEVLFFDQTTTTYSYFSQADILLFTKYRIRA